jgi:hypothetical protein
MPQNRPVQVGVALSNNPTAKLEIRVKPWAVVVHDGDTVEWVPTAINGQAVRVTIMEIHRQTGAGPWPFSNSPPYAGGNPKSATRKPLGGSLTLGMKIPYTIVITFTDDDGNPRTASIDPDMIIPD